MFEVRGWFHSPATFARLLEAKTTDVPSIIAELNLFRRWADPLLHEAIGSDQYANDKKKALHLSLADALSKVDNSRTDYKLNRPHSALNNETPEGFAQASHMTSRGELPRKRRNE